MDLIRITTDDYELTVRAEGVDKAFHRASDRNTNILNSTEYAFDGSNAKLFELISVNGNELCDYLEIATFNTPIHPVFYENKDYYFDVIFKNQTDLEPVIYCSLQEIKSSFITRKVQNNFFLTGAINYRNDIGKTDFMLRYKKNGIHYTHKFSFEVFPVKLDYKSDYRSIISDINREFSFLIFDVLKKTYSGFKEGSEVNNDIIWWGIFGQLYKDILTSSKLILNKPHNRLIQDTYYSKADRIKVLNYELEEQIAENKENTQKYYREELKTLTANTLENQFFKYSVFNVLHNFIAIKTKLLKYSGLKLTREFKYELEQIETELSTITHNPFFKKIDEFKGFRQESIVLHRATGYSTLFRSWIILKKGIDFLDGLNKIELKNIADLYEIWCFIEMKNIIEGILNKKPEEINIAEILLDGFTIQLRAGKKSKISFRRGNGDLVELYHELKYSDCIFENTLSHTVSQEPDIVLRITKNDLKDNYQFTYLFDAKYRLVSDDSENSKDYPPDDAINQMHRYRDAIYYQDNHESNRPKKEVIGAYVLYPGANNAEEIEKLYFQKSIHQVNIGAYPLIPGIKKNKNNSLLIGFLKEVLDTKDSVDILNDDIISHKGMKYEDPNALVLAGFISSNIQREYFRAGEANVYHLPVYLKGGSINTIKDLDKLKYFCPIIDGIIDYYEITEIRVCPRRDIFNISHILFRNSTESYYAFSLNKRIGLTHKIESASSGNRIFRYARLSQLKSSRTINDFNKKVLEIMPE